MTDNGYTHKAQNARAADGSQAMMLSSNPAKAMQEMMDTIDALRNIYEEENDALMRVDTVGFLNLQDQKIEAARHYQAGAKQIILNREKFKNIDPTLREKLIQKQDEFSNVASENLQALDRVRGAVSRLNDRVMKSARDAAGKNKVNYGHNGSLDVVERRVSLGLNESA